MKNSYADQIKMTKVMLAGLKANQEILAKWGVDPAYLTDFEKQFQDTLAFDNDQQALKSRLKEKTAAVKENYAFLRKKRRNVRNMVKDHLPQESWKEFGIEATR